MLNNGIKAGDFSYETLSNKKLMQSAYDALTRKLDRGINEITIKEQWLNSQNRFNSKHLVEGEILVTEFAKNGDYKSAYEIATKISRRLYRSR